MNNITKVLISIMLAVSCLVVQASANQSEILEIFDPEVDGLPEAITTDYMGNIYVAMGAANKVNKFTASGVLLETYSLPVPDDGFTAGLVVNWDLDIFVNVTSQDADAKGVWRIKKSGEITKFADVDPSNSGFVNGMTIDRYGNLFVTDSQAQKIYKISPDGEVAVWLDDDALLGLQEGSLLGFPVGANGIAISRSGKFIYVANLDKGTILSVRVKRNGSAGRVKEIVKDPMLRGVDGIAVGPRGKIYAAVNLPNRIVRVSPRRGHIEVIEEGGNLDFPSDLVLGRGQDAFSIYIANFSALSNTLPALLKIDNGGFCRVLKRKGW